MTRPLHWFEDISGEMARMWQERPLLRWPMRGFPHVDIFERGNRLVVKADLPAMKRDEFELRLDDGDLVISGERHEKDEVKEEDYYRVERASGEFCRRICLPFAVEAKDVNARFEDGVLEIEIPKPAETKPIGEKIRIR